MVALFLPSRYYQPRAALDAAAIGPLVIRLRDGSILRDRAGNTISTRV